MKKLLATTVFLLIAFLTGQVSFAKETNAFVSIVNPVRGGDFWDLTNERPSTAVKGEADILIQANVLATWLVRFDALEDSQITDQLKKLSFHEKGLFLEVTPTWTKDALVSYHQSKNWHDAGSALLTGYEREEREKLIDTAFAKFKRVFGYYPKSTGAWWIDAYSLDYMQKKYGITAGLIVSDQYTTDNYQIWGQYFSTPYYPDKSNALHTAQSSQNKIPVVLSQWAARDPLNGYGNSVWESTFSVQANDYMDFHALKTDYFAKLLDIYLSREFNQFGSVVVGLENSYEWSKYGEEYKKQIDVLIKKRQDGQVNITTLKDFASWYTSEFPQLSPAHLLVVNDPLSSFKKVVWFMNPYYRAGWFYNQDGSLFRDIRQYVEGEEEICFKKRCDQVNFATFATRVLDEVTYGQKMVIDEGKISDFAVTKEVENFVISYKNEAGLSRKIEFLPRDISIDGKISSIDGLILETTKYTTQVSKKTSEFPVGGFEWNIFSVIFKIAKFLLFLLLAIFIPGYILVNRLEIESTKKIFISFVSGLVSLTLVFYIASLFDLRFLTFIYVLGCLLLFVKLKLFASIKLKFSVLSKLNLLILAVILTGTVFQNLPTFKSGLIFPFGMGLWGPNTHDGVWHLSLINQLIKGLPAENPIFALDKLKNYHFFYDLLIAASRIFTNIPLVDLVFRFYPVLFSLLLGWGTYQLVTFLTKNKIALFFSLYLVYFAGSFGWIVEYIREKHLGGESAFWANQSISFNLNPPFAISLIVIIALFLILPLCRRFRSGIFLAILLAGSLMGFKSYGAFLILSSLLLTGLIKRERGYLLVFLGSSVIAAWLFFSNFAITSSLVMFAPFWFIHSMIDSPDRVGWFRLSLARETGLAKGDWFKFFTAEAVSLFLFIIGNLGMRFVSLFSLLKMKDIFGKSEYFFMLTFSLLSVLIPILFIQAGNPWNTIQFTYYFLYLAAVAGGLVFASVIVKLNKLIATAAVIIFMILTPINSWATANGYLSYQPHAFISKQELEALKYLQGQEDGVVLTYPYDEKLKNISEPWSLMIYSSTAYVSAFSAKSVFLEDEPQNQILLTDYKKRLVAAKDFFLRSNLEGEKFLLDNQIKYIYLPKIYNVRLNEGQVIKNIFENNEVIIYGVK